MNDSEVTVPPIVASNNTAKQLASSETIGFPGVASQVTAERLVASEFMASPSQSVLNDMISRFIDASSNEALKTTACGSCARETSLAECEEIALKDIPNKHHLIPHSPHAAHELVNGLLIYPAALGASKETMHLCDGCRNHLKKDV